MIDYNKIHDYIQSKREEIVNELCSLVRIASVTGTPECGEALRYIKKLYEQNGFETELFDTYLLAKYKKGEKSLGLFAHADVVEANGEWTECKNPFEPQIKKGVIYGRGVIDDKSAVVISLYAMKLIKELGIDFDSSLISFTGACEEVTMQDARDYVKSHTLPDFSLVLDAAFPIYLGDKGMLWLDCILANELEELIDLRGGNATNITLGRADARVKYSKELHKELLNCKELLVEVQNGELIISAQGVSTHGATPQGSKNAGAMILGALLATRSFSKRDKSALEPVYKILNTYDGEALGIKASDQVFGDTTATNGIVRVENGRLFFTLDIRYGASYTATELVEMVDIALSADNITYEIKKKNSANVISANNKHASACMMAYKKHTGDSSATPRINAGGTYSKLLPNSCETGTTTKWEAPHLPKGHGGAHQPDECISIDGLLEALEIIVKMLIECDKIKE